MSEIARELQLRAEIHRWADDLRRSGATGDARIRTIEERIKAETDEIALDALKFALRLEYEDKGEDAAVDALDRELLSEVEYWYQKLTQANRSDYRKNIGPIEDKIRAKPDAPEVDQLYNYLAEQVSLTGDYARAETIYLQLAERHPDDPLPLNRAAFNKYALQEQPEAAMPIIERALEVSYRTGEHRRYILGTKARIALELKRYDVVESVLSEIMRLKMDSDIPDVKCERDFFDRLPPDSIDPEVARRYEAFCLAAGRARRR